ncbi:hypothetical protein CPB85DRAFT_1221995 [Mucidula mucida]|nr:hypothetical protein CPB85DRAFT_1221995 [Mucidula mucida]
MVSRRVPNNLTQSNQVGEALAAAELAKRVNKNAKLHNDTDSRYVLNHLSTSRQKMEDTGYIGVPNSIIIRAMVAKFRERKNVSTLKWVKGHNGHEGNKIADLLANNGAYMEDDEPLNLEIPRSLQVTGAKLAKLTQKLAYQAFRSRELKTVPRRSRTDEMLKATQSEAKEAFGETPTVDTLWTSLRGRDIERNTCYMLWMMMHDAYRVGSYWLKPHYAPEYQERARCRHCNGEIESMKHILTECSSPGQKEIWEMTKDLVENRLIPWRTPSVATILSSVKPIFKNWDDKRESGKERFFRIVMTTTAQVIWNARCERVIQKNNAEFSPEQVKNRWKKMINKRLELDCLMTHRRFGKKALSKKKVLMTWKGLLKDEHNLPKDWTEVGGVLVGTVL